MQEIEEKTKESWRKQTQPETSAYECFFHYTDELLYSAGFKEGLKFAQQWVSCEDKSPQTEGKYLVKRNGVIEIEKWILNNNNVGFWWDYIGITHWRPININN